MAKSDIKMRIIFFVAIVLVASCVAEAALGTVNVAYTGHGAGRQLYLWGGGRSSYQTYFGVYMLNKTGGTDEGAEWPNGPLGVFCIELTEYASTSTLTYNVVMPQDAQDPQTFLGGPVGLSKANYLRELWGRFFNPSWVGSGGHTTQQNNDAAAFGACV
ncbi:MAG: hypothetical protein MUO27_09190, partial [Sedimentisphaerales bacterium]|nr:hypothetical protein [Sedimentisphaerales bacterium]